MKKIEMLEKLYETKEIVKNQKDGDGLQNGMLGGAEDNPDGAADNTEGVSADIPPGGAKENGFKEGETEGPSLNGSHVQADVCSDNETPLKKSK